MNLQQQVAEKLKIARVEAQMTQGDVARETGLLRNNISVIESGSNVKLATVEKIAFALGKKIVIQIEDLI